VVSAVVVGRGKSGWNKLLRKPSISGKEKTIAEASAAKAAAKTEMLEDPDEAELVYTEESDKLVSLAEHKGKGRRVVDPLPKERVEEVLEDEEEEEGDAHGMFHGAGKFLLAGGVAGAGEFSPAIRTTHEA
jgi:hypothetical protein